MPIYDYHCAKNQQTIEVMHKMNEHINTWQELCALANIDVGKTPLDTPVKRIITGGNLKLISELPRFDETILPK